MAIKRNFHKLITSEIKRPHTLSFFARRNCILTIIVIMPGIAIVVRLRQVIIIFYLHVVPVMVLIRRSIAIVMEISITIVNAMSLTAVTVAAIM